MARFERSLRPLLPLLLLVCGIPAVAEPPTLLLSANGEALSADAPGLPPNSLQVRPPLRIDGWSALRLENGALRVLEVRDTRRPDWTLRERPLVDAPAAWAGRPARIRHALALPADALFGFSVLDGSAAPAPQQGLRPSALPAPVLLRAGWRGTIRIGEARWTLATEHERRRDGRLLAGSLRVVAEDARGRRRLLVPPAHGMAFRRQELLWVGSLGIGGDGPDALVKRIRLTGEVEYVLSAAGAQGWVAVDEDRPHRAYAVGIEELETLESHDTQRRQAPDPLRGPGFEIAQSQWTAALDAAAAAGLPKTLFDRRLAVDGESLRFTVDYLPRLAPLASGETSSAATAHFPAETVLYVHAHGRRQALLEMARPDESDVLVRIGTIAGAAAIEIEYGPHYNLDLRRVWVWDAERGRFVRLLIGEAMGC